MKSFVFITFILLSLSACSKKDVLPEPYPTDSLGRINRWILDSMRRFYYWSDAIPVSPDHTQSPDQFFKNLLSASDRFSHISGPDVPSATNSYFTYGFHYAFMQVPGETGYIGVMTFVNRNGAAANAGCERGTYFIKVNGASIHSQNIDQVNQLLNDRGNITITTASYTDSGWIADKEIQLSPGYAGENAVYYTRIFNGNNIKTGYLYYTSFNESYDANLLEAFAKFRQAGVKELIVDLRYNAGGSVATCAKLSALIARNLTAGEVFAIYEGNRHEGKRSRTLQQVLNTSGSAAGRQFAQLQAAQVSISRVFILTTAATVSSAEMTINNLKPFLQVVQIGETTTGKDEASFTITDQRIPKQVDWVLQPIVYKLFNKSGQGGYSQGIAPQYAVTETASLPLGAIGTNADALVHKALELIYGPGFTGDPEDLRERSQHPAINASAIYRSAVEQAVKAAPVVVTFN